MMGTFVRAHACRLAVCVVVAVTSFVARDARAESDVVACFAKGGPLGAIASGQALTDMKNTARFAVNHPSCLAGIVSQDYVMIGLGGGLSGAKEAGLLAKLSITDETQCSQAIDTTVQKAVAAFLAPIAKAMGLPQMVLEQIQSIAAGEVSAGLREIPGLGEVFERWDCGCAIAYSGLAADRLIEEVKGQYQSIAACGNLIMGAVTAFWHGIQAGSAEIAGLLGFGECDQMTSDQYRDAVYLPAANALALATSNEALLWWNANSMAMFDNCYAYYRSGTSSCRMSTNNALETCNLVQNPFFDLLAVARAAAQKTATTNLEKAIAAIEPGVQTTWKNTCNSSVDAEPARQDCKNAVPTCVQSARTAAFAKLVSAHYVPAAGLETFQLAAKGRCGELVSMYMAEAKQLSAAANAKITAAASEAWRVMLVGIWTKQCTDATCWTEVQAAAKGIPQAMIADQAAHPDESSLSVNTRVLPAYVKQFQLAVAASVKRKTAYQPVRGAARLLFATKAATMIKQASKKCPDSVCIQAVFAIGAKRNDKMASLFETSFPPYLAVTVAQRDAFVAGQLEEAKAEVKVGIAAAKNRVKVQKRHETELAALSELVGSHCETACRRTGKRGRLEPNCATKLASCRAAIEPTARACIAKEIDVITTVEVPGPNNTKAKVAMPATVATITTACQPKLSPSTQPGRPVPASPQTRPTTPTKPVPKPTMPVGPVTR